MNPLTSISLLAHVSINVQAVNPDLSNYSPIGEVITGDDSNAVAVMLGFGMAAFLIP